MVRTRQAPVSSRGWNQFGAPSLRLGGGTGFEQSISRLCLVSLSLASGPVWLSWYGHGKIFKNSESIAENHIKRIQVVENSGFRNSVVIVLCRID